MLTNKNFQSYRAGKVEEVMSGQPTTYESCNTAIERLKE